MEPATFSHSCPQTHKAMNPTGNESGGRLYTISKTNSKMRGRGRPKRTEANANPIKRQNGHELEKAP